MCGSNSATNGICAKCAALKNAITKQESSRVAIGAIIPNTKIVRIETPVNDSLAHPEAVVVAGGLPIAYDPPKYEHDHGPSIFSVFIGGTFTITMIMVVWFALGLDASPVGRLRELITENSAQASTIKLPVGYLKPQEKLINSSGKLILDGTSLELGGATAKKDGDNINVYMRVLGSKSISSVTLTYKFNGSMPKGIESLTNYKIQFNTPQKPIVIENVYSKRLTTFDEMSRLLVSNNTISGALDGEQKLTLNNRTSDIRWHFDFSSQLN